MKILATVFATGVHCAVFLGCFCSLHAAANEFPTVSDVRISEESSRTRIAVHLSEIVNFDISLLDEPYRVVVDFPRVDFGFSDKAVQKDGGLVESWRYGLISDENSRIILDTAHPVKVYRSFMLPPLDSQSARLILELEMTTKEAYEANPSQNSSEISKDRKLTSPQSDSQRRNTLKLKKERPVVVIDPGHGGPDTGAEGSTGIQEKTIVLDFAFILKKQLEEISMFDVHLTRRSDRFLSLADRVDFARERQADLFISLHADSVRQSYVRGATTYTLSDKASDSMAESLAESENKSDKLAGIDLEYETETVSSILYDLSVRETRYFSNLYSQFLTKEISNTTKINKNPQRSGGFLVLKAPDVPSVLLELGYLSNREDEELLISKDWQAEMADSVAASIIKFFEPR